jgi:hypothetical protein
MKKRQAKKDFTKLLNDIIRQSNIKPLEFTLDEEQRQVLVRACINLPWVRISERDEQGVFTITSGMFT